MAALLRARPTLRYAVNRVQNAADHAYSELRDNFVGEDCRPVDILRAKLAYFGACKFDPKRSVDAHYDVSGCAAPGRVSGADDWVFHGAAGARGMNGFPDTPIDISDAELEITLQKACVGIGLDLGTGRELARA